jgi:hypothetical protein
MLQALVVLSEEEMSIAMPVIKPAPPWSEAVKLKRWPGPEPAAGTAEFATGSPPAATR